MHILNRYRDASTGQFITTRKGKANPATSTLEAIEIEDGLPGLIKQMVDDMSMVPESDLAEFQLEMTEKIGEYRAELLGKSNCEEGF